MKTKFGEIFWGEVEMVDEKGEGDTSKREMVILFSHHHIVAENSGYYKCETNILLDPQLHFLNVLYRRVPQKEIM